jgi:hypothetical protein
VRGDRRQMQIVVDLEGGYVEVRQWRVSGVRACMGGGEKKSQTLD